MLDETRESLEDADVLTESLGANLDQDKLQVDQPYNRVHHCNQQISALRLLIDRLSESIQHDLEQVPFANDVEFGRACSVVTSAINEILRVLCRAIASSTKEVPLGFLTVLPYGSSSCDLLVLPEVVHSLCLVLRYGQF